MKKNLIYWIAASTVVTIIFGTIYATGQYILRSGANDPQIQLAEDIATRLNNGASPGNQTSNKVDVAKSLSPFVIIYDKQGKELNGSVQLDGKTPELPKGVFSYANPQYTVTWEPKSGVRIAAVVRSTNNGYVLAGRNLREVENRENILLILVGIGWGVSEVVVTLAFLLFNLRLINKTSKKAKKIKRI